MKARFSARKPPVVVPFERQLESFLSWDNNKEFNPSNKETTERVNAKSMRAILLRRPVKQKIGENWHQRHLFWSRTSEFAFKLTDLPVHMTYLLAKAHRSWREP